MIRTTAAAALVGFGLIAAGAAVGAPAVSAAPAAGQGPLPAFTFTSHLEALLVTPRQLTTITGAESSMRALATVTDLNDGDPGLTPTQCGGAFEPARRSAYADSGYTGVSSQLAADDKPGRARHLVNQAVIGFADLGAALEHLNAAAKTWARCGGRLISYTTQSGAGRRWRLGEPELRRGKTVLAQVQTGRTGSCERAMAAADLAGAAVIADVMSCDFDGGEPDGQAERIADAISANAQRQPGPGQS